MAGDTLPDAADRDIVQPPPIAMVRLESARLVEPYVQGHFDGLCGLYTALNGLRLISAERRQPLDDTQCETLFRHGVAYLHARNKLTGAVRYGLRIRLWVRLVEELSVKAGRMLGVQILVQQPFRKLDAVPLGFIVEAARQAIRERMAVLLLLKGSYDHFTVVCGVGATQLRLFDSYGYRWVRIASCLPAGEGMAPRHDIPPASVLFLAA